MRYGFIGAGNMGGALAKALCKTVSGSEVLLSDKMPGKAEALAKELSCQSGSAVEAAACGTVFLGVKPQMMAAALEEVKPALQVNSNVLLISMAAGLSMAEIRRLAGGDYPVIRIMPNMPVAVGEGMILYDRTENVTDEMLQTFLQDMQAAGLFDALPESLIDAGSAVSGCGPAFAFLMMEALADGGVRCGLPRQKAQMYAAQMLKGSAAQLLESGLHPGQLKDAVCSPGGTTIAGVEAMERGGFRAAAMDAVTAAYERTKELAK